MKEDKEKNTKKTKKTKKDLVNKGHCATQHGRESFPFVVGCDTFHAVYDVGGHHVDVDAAVGATQACSNLRFDLHR